jgi:hypothetical protein
MGDGWRGVSTSASGAELGFNPMSDLTSENFGGGGRSLADPERLPGHVLTLPNLYEGSFPLGEGENVPASS